MSSAGKADVHLVVFVAHVVGIAANPDVGLAQQLTHLAGHFSFVVAVARHLGNLDRWSYLSPCVPRERQG